MVRISIRDLLVVTALAVAVISLCIYRYNGAVAQREQDRKAFERYERLPILGPITSAAAAEPPSDDEVVRAWEKANRVQGGLPFLHETERKNVRIVKEKIADYIDPPRVVPLIGPVKQHHAHYKCTIYCTEVTRVGWPIQHTAEEDSQEIVYIDHNHFQMVE